MIAENHSQLAAPDRIRHTFYEPSGVAAVMRAPATGLEECNGQHDTCHRPRAAEAANARQARLAT